MCSPFYGQARACGIDEKDCWVVYESSRGCWWSIKRQCNFCGVNGDNKKYRYKKPGKIF